MYRYYSFYKPYGFLSQFTDEGKWKGLHHLLQLEKDVYPLGRLDADSEGLLLLTNNRRINKELLDHSFAHNRTYHVQVEGLATTAHIQQLLEGVSFKAKGKVYSGRCEKAEVLKDYKIDPRDPPIRFRKHIPTSWISITLTEGKNRQVRKMTAAVGLPCLRLIRTSIEDLSLEGQPGDIQTLDEAEFMRKLRL